MKKLSLLSKQLSGLWFKAADNKPFLKILIIIFGLALIITGIFGLFILFTASGDLVVDSQKTVSKPQVVVPEPSKQETVFEKDESAPNTVCDNLTNELIQSATSMQVGKIANVWPDKKTGEGSFASCTYYIDENSKADISFVSVSLRTFNNQSSAQKSFDALKKAENSEIAGVGTEAIIQSKSRQVFVLSANKLLSISFGKVNNEGKVEDKTITDFVSVATSALAS